MTTTGDQASRSAKRTFGAGSLSQATDGRRWSWPQYLAVLGVPILVWEVWTLTAWLADGPAPVTGFGGRGSANWWVARVYEALAVTVALAVGIYIVRNCIRVRQVLTFDAMFVISGLTIWWADVGLNFFQPTIMFSSNWVNVNNTCGHMPFVVNPDCGRTPEPILFAPLLESFGVLACAIVAGAAVRWARTRWPGISTPKLIWMLIGGGLMVELIMEPPIIAFGLWNYAPGPLAIPVGPGLHFPLITAVAGALWFGPLVAARVFKNDKGQTFLERGMEHYSPRRRKAVTFLAIYAFYQMATWGPGSLTMLYSPFQREWPEIPSYLLNGVCDAPGVTGTRYGPCPGSPGFRMPTRTSPLPEG